MTAAEPAVLKKRLLSLDVFRGLTIAMMILVNDPGDWGHIYPPLEHSKWNGCTPTDLVFPFFLFMVGVSIVYAMESKKTDPALHNKIMLHAFRRMVILLLITYTEQMIFHPGFGHLRFPGVLPRIAVVYFIATVLYLKTSQKTRDWLFAGILIGYCILMTFVPVPGVGPASLEPAKNMGALIDRTVFTPNHLWSESHTWDPEGLLGTLLPAVATALFGIRLGSWIKRNNVNDSTKVSWMFFYGMLAVISGLIWDLFFPINKALWTSSFVLYAGGLACMGLAFCYWLIDVQGHKRFTYPFVVFGANAITAYVLSAFIPHYMGKITFGGHSIYQTLFAPNFSPINASLASAIFTVIILWLVMWLFYLKKIFIKI